MGAYLGRAFSLTVPLTLSLTASNIIFEYRFHFFKLMNPMDGQNICSVNCC